MENPKAVANQAKNTILFGQFYVQLGAFHEMENALKKAQELDDQFSQNASVLEDNEPTGQPMFKLNLGPFDSEEEADLFVQVLRDRNIEALVKKSQF
ncbi:MAG: SPOR domain-containing protein [Saprospiraceae bacterium]